MAISVPCSIIVAIVYVLLPDFNDLHGKSLSFYSLCLATGYLLLSYVLFSGDQRGILGYIIQYFMLAAYFWVLFMIIDIAIQVWIYLPKHIESNYEGIRLIIYFMLSQGMPLLFVYLTHTSGYHGLPSYLFKAIEFSKFCIMKFCQIHNNKLLF